MRKLISALAVTLLVASTAFAADTAAKGEYANHCAWGLTMGKQVPTDCKINWKDTAGKTYCFSTEQAKADWAKDTKGAVAKADTEFAKVAKTEGTHATH